MTAAADRHLLFGLLALQNGLIDQGQLMLAFQAWTRDKSRGLADHLEARGDLTAAKKALLDALAEVHLEAHGGDVEKSLAAIPADRSTRAGLAELGEPAIEATLARIARPEDGHATEADDDHDPDRTGTLAVGGPTGDGQRFRLLRPHARGGLGEVFVALDGELHREVALKQILEKHADDPTSRQRFVLEAEVTGGLEHPGIVPVYGLGTYGGGRPYYAMRFIRGESLKEAIEAFHGRVGFAHRGDADGRATVGKAHPTGTGTARWNCVSSSAASSTSATPSITPIPAARSIATSSRPTSSSASTARRWWSTGGWPRPWAGPIRRWASRPSPRRRAGHPRPCPAAPWARRPT